MKLICYSDTHIRPDYAEDSLFVLREIAYDALKYRPEYIVCTGDIGTFSSQQRYAKDRGSYSLEEELKMVADCFRMMLEVIEEYNRGRRRLKKKLYRPCFVFCLGNHDEGVWQDLITCLAYVFKKYPFRWCHYRETICIDGIYFSHTFENGISGSMCSSAKDILKNTHECTVSGHSHVRSIHEETAISGKKLFAIKLPCATIERPQWAGQGANQWDTGWLRLETEDHFDYQFMRYSPCA